MKFLIFGLGSMGKRRIRCLHALGYNNILGYDSRKDRISEAREKYGIEVTDSISDINYSGFDAFIISTPPDQHTQYLKLAIDNKIPAFVEASVILEEVETIRKYNTNSTFIAPSCTLRFHPVIKDIKSIIKGKKYGKVTNFSYHSGQYLPDWHPWEKVSDFYVSNRLTGGGREIVPFEVTWIVDAIGWPNDAKGVFKRTIDFGSDIEDSYAFVLNYDNMVGTVIVDVAARYATRSLIINMEYGQIQWRWEEGCFLLYESENNRWIKFNQPEIKAETGYNKNIGEEMYYEEIGCFLNGIKDATLYPNSIEDDIKVLNILNKIENSDGGF